MRKPKVTCFRYKRHNDIYVSNVSFSTDALLSMLDVFSEQKIMILIESDENNIRTVSSIGKSIGIAEMVSDSPVPRFSASCNKTELHCLLMSSYLISYLSVISPTRLPNPVPRMIAVSGLVCIRSLMNDAVS